MTSSSTYERRLLTPQRSWRIDRGHRILSSGIKISEGERDVNSVSVESSKLSSKTTLSIQEATSTKGPVVAAAQFTSKEPTLVIYLGEPAADEHPSTTAEEDVDAGMLDRNIKFQIDGQLYAWQCTCRHSIRIPTADGEGISEETNGQDWKMIRMSAAEPQINDPILAVYMRQRKDSSLHADSGAANVHWFESVTGAVERVGLAVILGLLEREKKGAKEYSSGTSLLFGSGV